MSAGHELTLASFIIFIFFPVVRLVLYFSFSLFTITCTCLFVVVEYFFLAIFY